MYSGVFLQSRMCEEALTVLKSAHFCDPELYYFPHITSCVRGDAMIHL